MDAKNNKPVGLAVCRERFRYLENADGSVKLFDVLADPQEWKNLATDPAHAADLAAMKKRQKCGTGVSPMYFYQS